MKKLLLILILLPVFSFGQTSRNWTGMAAAPNGNVNATDWGIAKKLNESGNLKSKK